MCRPHDGSMMRTASVRRPHQMLRGVVTGSGLFSSYALIWGEVALAHPLCGVPVRRPQYLCNEKRQAISSLAFLVAWLSVSDDAHPHAWPLSREAGEGNAHECLPPKGQTSLTGRERGIPLEKWIRRGRSPCLPGYADAMCSRRSSGTPSSSGSNARGRGRRRPLPGRSGRSRYESPVAARARSC
jgi:hypothetical protein